MVGKAGVESVPKSKILIGITYDKEISQNKRDAIEQYYFMHAAEKFDYEIEYIWSKTGSYRKHNQIRSCNDKRFDF